MMSGAVSALRDTRHQGTSRSAPSAAASENRVNTLTRGKVAEIVKHPRLCLSEARAVLRRHAKAVIYGAFPERSRYATCQRAAATFGVSPDTIERLIEGDTSNPCPLILGYCAKLIRERTGSPTPICHVLAHITAVEISPTLSHAR